MKNVFYYIFLLFFIFSCSKNENLDIKDEENKEVSNNVIRQEEKQKETLVNTWKNIKNNSSWGTLVPTPKQNIISSKKDYKKTKTVNLNSNNSNNISQGNTTTSISSTNPTTKTSPNNSGNNTSNNIQNPSSSSTKTSFSTETNSGTVETTPSIVETPPSSPSTNTHAS